MLNELDDIENDINCMDDDEDDCNDYDYPPNDNKNVLNNDIKITNAIIDDLEDIESDSSNYSDSFKFNVDDHNQRNDGIDADDININYSGHLQTKKTELLIGETEDNYDDLVVDDECITSNNNNNNLVEVDIMCNNHLIPSLETSYIYYMKIKKTI